MNILNILLEPLNKYISNSISSIIAFMILVICSVIILSYSVQRVVQWYFNTLLDNKKDL